MTEIYVTKTRESIVYKLAGDLLGGGKGGGERDPCPMDTFFPFFL